MSSSLEQKLNEVRNKINNNPATSNYIEVDEWLPLRNELVGAVIQSLPDVELVISDNSWGAGYNDGRNQTISDVMAKLERAKSPSPDSGAKPDILAGQSGKLKGEMK